MLLTALRKALGQWLRAWRCRPVICTACSYVTRWEEPASGIARCKQQSLADSRSCFGDSCSPAAAVQICAGSVGQADGRHAVQHNTGGQHHAHGASLTSACSCRACSCQRSCRHKPCWKGCCSLKVRQPINFSIAMLVIQQVACMQRHSSLITWMILACQQASSLASRGELGTALPACTCTQWSCNMQCRQPSVLDL